MSSEDKKPLPRVHVLDVTTALLKASEAIDANNRPYNINAKQEAASEADVQAIALHERQIRDHALNLKLAGAAGGGLPPLVTPLTPDEISNERYWRMQDPYVAETRRKFEDSVFQCQPLHKGLENRSNAFFRKGFHFEVELKSTRTPDGKELDPTGVESAQTAAVAKYQKYLLTLETWAYSQNIGLKNVMDSANIMSFVQGRSLSLIVPPISQLRPNELPMSVQTLSWEDTGEPIVDKYYWTLAACLVVNMMDKTLAMRDEMVYLTRKSWSLRKWSRFFGSSMVEAVVQSARIFKKLVDYDFAKAITAGYMTKILLEVENLPLDETERDAYLDNLLAKMATTGGDYFAFEKGITPTAVAVKVDTEMITKLYAMLFEMLASATGSTKSQMGVTDGLTRDNATIQEIVFMKYVREVDEALVKDAFETQLLTPLLAHLAGEDVDKMPVQVIIVSDDEEMDNLADPNLQTKQQDIQAAALENSDTEAMKQPDSKDQTFGAAGGNGKKSLQERDVEATENLVELLREQYGKNHKAKEIG